MNDSIETREVREFLRNYPPFDQLPETLLERAARAVKISYHRQGSGETLLDPDSLKLYIVRSGAYEIRSSEDELLDRIDVGGYFGYPSLLTGDAITNRALVIEDGLLYQIDEETFQRLRSQDRHFDRFFNQVHAKRLRRAVRQREQHHMLNQRVHELMVASPISVAPDCTIEVAAQVMSEARISSVLVEAGGRLQGILTDRDLRARVLAQGKTGRIPVCEVMSRAPVTIGAEVYLFQAVMLMSEHNVHHLPVIDADGRTCGVLSSTDLVKSQKSDPVLLIGEISRQSDIAGLQRVSRDIPELLRNLIARDARADEIGRVVTTVTDALTRQLIQQAVNQLGEPPVPFTWLAFGSQGRRDQTAKSDQDNALLLSDAFEPQHDAYFKALAQHVCDGLNACGYDYCHGEIMAITDRWRKPLKTWQHYFLEWIHEPSNKALMHASIFFDVRAVYGDSSLLEALQQTILDASQKNSIFLAYMTQNALTHTPPLGFFRQFVVERNGEHANAFDMKKRGVVPITDIGRIYALAAGVEAVNTLERLRAAVDAGMLSLKACRDLCDAYEYISHLRLENQGRMLERGEAADNYLQPEDVSDLVRHQLRDAFNVVVQAQSVLKMKFTRGYL